MNKQREKIFNAWRISHRLLKYFVNEILHHANFKPLEASWRGLQLLVLTHEQPMSNNINVKFLNISFTRLKNHLSTGKVENSLLFRKVYHQEYNHPGGEPYNLLIGDFMIDISKNSHVSLLEKLSLVSSYAFAPLILGVNDGNEKNTIAWNALRLKSSASFIGLLYPQVLIRCPYAIERIDTVEDYLWGNACYDYAACAIVSFLKTGWFYDLYARAFSAQRPFVRYDQFLLDSCAPLNRKSIIKNHLPKNTFKRLNEKGLTLLVENTIEGQIAFSHHLTFQNDLHSKQTLTPIPVLLCMIRFIHCLKVMFRNKIGCLSDAKNYEDYLQNWLLSYCSNQLSKCSRLKTKYPLSRAKIMLTKKEKNLSACEFTIKIQPHFYHHEVLKFFLADVFNFTQTHHR